MLNYTQINLYLQGGGMVMAKYVTFLPFLLC